MSTKYIARAKTFTSVESIGHTQNHMKSSIDNWQVQHWDHTEETCTMLVLITKHDNTQCKRNQKLAKTQCCYLPFLLWRVQVQSSYPWERAFSNLILIKTNIQTSKDSVPNPNQEKFQSTHMKKINIRSIPYEVIRGEWIAIPDSYLKIPKAFKHSEHKLLLEHSALSTIWKKNKETTSKNSKMSKLFKTLVRIKEGLIS